MIVLVNPNLIRKGFLGITLWPFVILKERRLKMDEVFMNHERIHLRQQAEMLIVFFYVWYGIEFLLKWMRFKNKKAAYYAISFEREAYKNEKDLNYIKKRPFWGFISYLY